MSILDCVAQYDRTSYVRVSADGVVADVVEEDLVVYLASSEVVLPALS